jgi:L-fucose isomerase-like protein
MNAAQAAKLLAEDKDKKIDGYIVCFEACWAGVPAAVLAAGKPTIFVDELYQGSGEWLIQNSAARRRKAKVAGISTSRIEDVADAARCFEILKKPGGTVDAFLAAVDASRKKNTKPAGDLSCTADPVKAADVGKCLEQIKNSTILAIGGHWPNAPKAFQDVFGIKVVATDFKEIQAAYEKADLAEARKWADRWIGEAERVVEPKRDEIERSGAMYLAMKDVMQRHNARAITINCLGGFYGGHMKAYPCLGFRQFNDDGLVGGCECDLVSAATMVILGHLVGRPGFISDPVIDTSKNQIIYAHCVGPTKVFGPQGASNPYHIRSHSEDRKGAAIRALMPLGYLVSTLEFHPLRKEVIFHQGKAIENVDDDRACRTKLAAEVKGDIEKLMAEWDHWGWHRVTVYGDVREPVKELAKALKLKVVEEA